MSSIIAVLFLVLFSSKLTVCRWTLEIQLYSYVNPTSKTRFGSCCDTDENLFDNVCTNPCDNLFTFCLRPTPSSAGCQYGLYRTGTVPGGDTLTFTLNNVIGENSVPNPLTFNGAQWPDNDMLYLLVAIDDNDIYSRNEFIESFGTNLGIPGVTNGIFNTTISSFVSLQIGIRMRCQQYYYGDRCQVYCQPHDDDENGYFTCDSQGSKVCREGYKYNETNCTTAIEFTSTVNGLSSSSGITTSFVMISPSSLSVTNSLSSIASTYSSLTPSISSNDDDGNTVASSTNDSTTDIVIAVVVGSLVMLTITALVVITLFVLHKRRNNMQRKVQENGHTIDNPNYSSDPRILIDGEIYASDYYLISHNHGFERTLHNPLYDKPNETVLVNNDPLYSVADEIGSSIPLSSDVQYSEIYNTPDTELSYSVIRKDNYFTGKQQQMQNIIGNFPQNIEGHYEFDSV